MCWTSGPPPSAAIITLVLLTSWRWTLKNQINKKSLPITMLWGAQLSSWHSCFVTSHPKAITALVMLCKHRTDDTCDVCLCTSYLNSHCPQYELCLCIREVGLDLWRDANQCTVGHNRYHTHGLKGKLKADKNGKSPWLVFRNERHLSQLGTLKSKGCVGLTDQCCSSSLKQRLVCERVRN